MIDARTDAELLSALRRGERDAYRVLWQRHFGAGLRYARRMFPSRAEDLVSESFLAIYQQVTTTPKGPQFAFRSYLKAVIRNTSLRWHTDAEQVVDVELIEQIDPRDGLSRAEQADADADVLAAFEELPERWQRVLWLSEVAEAGRTEIARDLGIRPNAVSALQRRARHGMKLRWLSRQVPADLRTDGSHVARLLPQYLSEPRNATLVAEVTAHVSVCAMCEDLLLQMRGSATHVQGAALSAALLGALSAGVPATASLTGGTTAAAAVTTGSGALAWILTGGVTAATVGGIVLTSLFTVAPVVSEPAEALSPPSTTAPAASAPTTSSVLAPPASAASTGPASDPGDIVEPAPVTGRHNPDPSIPTTVLVNDPDGSSPAAPARPSAADPGVPDPGTAPNSSFSPGMTTPATTTGYLAPQIAGRTTPGSNIVFEVDAQRYAPAVAADGAWSFDPRGLQLAAGTHDYRVWAHDANTQSAPTTGSFTVLPLVVQGFEQLSGFQDMLVPEAQTTGLVIALTGPANGTVFVSTMEGHTAYIPLDETGHALRRLRMDSRGWYYFTFRVLDADGFWGPGTEERVDVYDPDVIMDPWGPDPDGMTFGFTEP
ncbi:MAG: sigma-70 family RNA polymerase sigma factor [Actinobacteria bacterium]|nr:sigma-70 family RNA polymerase sigma factor [Actinomycetota bacterium]